MDPGRVNAAGRAGYCSDLMAEGLDLDEGHIEWYTATLADEEEENGFMNYWMANINPVIGGDPSMGEGPNIR